MVDMCLLPFSHNLNMKRAKDLFKLLQQLTFRNHNGSWDLKVNIGGAWYNYVVLANCNPSWYKKWKCHSYILASFIKESFARIAIQANLYLLNSFLEYRDILWNLLLWQISLWYILSRSGRFLMIRILVCMTILYWYIWNI